MTIQECYNKMGADYQEVLGRLHNEAMIGKFVRMFLQDDSFQILEEALRRGDVKEAFRGAHTLKGVCQNLGFSNLYAPAYALTETLRAGQLEGTQEQFAKVAEQYQCTMDAIRALEERYAKLEVPVVSNNSANRWTEDVPMVVPEINPDHIEIIKAQRERLGTKRGFIAVKSNCSLQSYVPALNALKDTYGIKQAMVCTYQAISGAGKTFETMPEIIDNVIPYIGGEEEKSEQEPLKIWGHIEGNKIVNADGPKISSQCLRVPVSDGHTAAIFVQFDKKPTKEEVIKAWTEYSGVPQELELPSAPKQFLHYFEEDNRPQAKLDRNLENGMAVSVGRLRPDTQYDYKFVCMSHNTLRGAAGGAVLLAELLCAEGYMD